MLNVELLRRAASITGAGSGIGRATAQRFAAAGASVVAADIDAVAAGETARLIEASGGRAIPAPVDVSSEADLREMIALTIREFGRLDVLVNNAGVVEGLDTQRLSFPDLDPARWSRMLDINLRGVILGTQLAIEAMRDQGGGVIVNVASGAGIGLAPHGAPVYAASKAAVVRFSAALAPLGEQINVRVNCICPGWVDTPMSRRARAEHTPEAWRDIAPAVMLRPEDVADSILSLVRDDALSGRVLLCYEGEAPRLLPATD